MEAVSRKVLERLSFMQSSVADTYQQVIDPKNFQAKCDQAALVADPSIIRAKAEPLTLNHE